ncbi:LapA family protein [Carnobacterium sp.]|uniref:LapA family protein n=1 Tax=Carnobacterium sp. TaxID=48221 RepID=UPI003C78DFB4
MIVFALLLLILVGLVAFLNTEMILFSLYFVTFTIPLWIALVSTLLIGMAIAALFASAKGARNRQVVRNKDNELDRSEIERKEAVDRVRQESEAQLEMQKKEAEIQRLNTELSLVKNKETMPASETVIQEVPVDTSAQENLDNDLHVEEYQVEPPEEKMSDKIRITKKRKSQ